MAKISKRYKALQKLVTPGKPYSLDEALKIIQSNSKTKFVESVDVAARLGVDAKKSDQQVRGSTVLPAGTGKSVRVAVFCPPGAKADEALAAGAEVVGMDDLADKMLAGDINYDVVIATPDAMRVVGKLARYSPARPDAEPKVGTVRRRRWRRAQREGRPGPLSHDKAGIIPARSQGHFDGPT